MSNQKKKVLVVDDEPHIFGIVQRYMETEDQNVQVLQALDARTGLNLVTDQEPDIVVLDIMMPGMNGLEMCETLRSTPETAHIPVIILSAKTSEDDIAAAYKAGANNYVTKPFSPIQLARLIKDMID